MKKSTTFLLALFLVLSTNYHKANAQVKELTPASKDIWKPLPQFQVSKPTEHHWYAIENENNQAYWNAVDVTSIIICLKSGMNSDAISDLITKYGLQSTTSKSMFPEVINFFVFKVPNSSKDKVMQIIQDGKQNNAVDYIEPEAIIRQEDCYSNDPYNYPNSGWKQWSIHTTAIDSAWCTAYMGAWGQWIGIIDNACDYTHPDIGTIYEYDFADMDSDVMPDGTGTQDHGTHVTGIAGGRISNSIGISGVSNDTVYFAKAVKNGETLFDNTAIVNAINDMAVEAKVRVVNMSFGATAPNATIQSACDNAWSHNKLLVAAAGNDASNENFYPAGYTSVISVGSVGVDPISYYPTFSTAFSNYGAKQELTAPGGNNDGSIWDIWSTLPSNSYGYKAGTSMASPMVAGLASLVFDVNPSLTNAEARTILQESVYDLGTTGWDEYYGYGMICGYCAVLNAASYISPTAITTLDPSTKSAIIFPNPNNGEFTIRFSKTGNSKQICIYNSLGQNVLTTTTNDNDISTDISTQPSGIYYIKIKDGTYEDVKMISLIK